MGQKLKYSPQGAQISKKKRPSRQMIYLANTEAKITINRISNKYRAVWDQETSSTVSQQALLCELCIGFFKDSININCDMLILIKSIIISMCTSTYFLMHIQKRIHLCLRQKKQEQRKTILGILQERAMWRSLDIKNMHYLLGLGHWEIKLLFVYLIYKDRHKEKKRRNGLWICWYDTIIQFAFQLFS